MATGLQYRETLNIISGGYPGEGVGSNGVAQNWTDTETLSGTSSVTYWYHDSATQDDSNSTVVEISLVESWSASIDSTTNVITVTVNSTLNSIVRRVVGSPAPISMSFFVRREPGGALLWDESCVDAATNYSYLPNPISLGQYTFSLQPGDATQSHSTIYYRNNACGYDTEPTPSIYVDEFGVGMSFRNVLPAPVTFSLNYNANGGTGAPATQTVTAIDSATFTVSSTQPTWGFYEFLGWSRTQYTDSRTEADVEYRAGDTITLQRANPSLTLYAVWRMDYRPGKTYNASNTTWWSHDRATGAADIRNAANTGWTTMRTIGGDGSRTGNPPYIYSGSNWANQRRIGSE